MSATEPLSQTAQVPSQDALMQMITGAWVSQSIYVAAIQGSS